MRLGVAGVAEETGVVTVRIGVAVAVEVGLTVGVSRGVTVGVAVANAVGDGLSTVGLGIGVGLTFDSGDSDDFGDSVSVAAEQAVDVSVGLGANKRTLALPESATTYWVTAWPDALTSSGWSSSV